MGDYKPWKHQAEATERAKSLEHFALFFQPGCGKTLAAGAMLRDKYEGSGKLLNTLILAPLVVLEQWKRELHRIPEIPRGLINVLSGAGYDKLRIFNQAVNATKQMPTGFIAITNYESLYNSNLLKHFLTWTEVLVCDESSKLKDKSAKRTKACVKIAENAKYRYILSGTPVLNSQLDIFSQFLVLDKGETFGRNFYIFRSNYFYDKNASWKSNHNYFPDWQPKPDCSERISQKIAAVSMHVKKEDAIDLPPLVKKEIFVEMGKEQKKAYYEMRDLFLTIVQDRTCVADMVLTKLLRLQQIVSGFIKFDDETEREFPEVPRLDALSELLEEIAPVEKVIVWACFKKNYLQIAKLCKKLNLPFTWLIGDVTDKDANVQLFQNDPTCRVMIANQQAGGIGVNLTAAGTAIFYSKNFSLEADVQAEARCHRGGSIDLHDKITRIDLISENTIDSVINAAISQKVRTSDEILSLIRKRL